MTGEIINGVLAVVMMLIALYYFFFKDDHQRATFWMLWSLYNFLMGK